ncbi:MAG TPA: triple tyrosine motif-containing protein, partial [Methylomirabilota bacterium]|nr:triple tyrosine motif-containing protein [Methylomirabilota bacterium]
VLIDGEPQHAATLRAPLPARVVVPASGERLEIHYTSLNLTAPERARFKHRLEGHEADWTEAGDVRVARYLKLPAGEYRFHVKAANEDGVWSTAGDTLAVVVLPPFWRTWWFVTGSALVLLGAIVATVRYFSVQKLQRQLAVLRQQEALEKERARIARDIHDQLGASMTQLALLGEMVEADKHLPQEVEQHARQICQTARDTTRSLDEIVWTVNPANDTLEGLANYICKYAQDYLTVAGLRCRIEMPAALPAASISPEVRHNVFLAAKEAITNVVRHARATSAWVRLRIEPDRFTFEIADDGRGLAGMDRERMASRNGLRNMRRRMEDVGGSFDLDTAAEGGLRIALTAPTNHR